MEPQLGNSRSPRKTFDPIIFLGNSILTLGQMFKYVICRGLEDILVVFHSSDAVPVQKIRKLVDQANRQAEPIWNDEERNFATRSAECNAILRPALVQNALGDQGSFNPLPISVAATLDDIFRKHYEHGNNCLSIGRAAEDAHNHQDAYAREAGRTLGLIRSSYESRTITSIGMAYGRTSMPFLCISSVRALWQVCQSSFYTRQLSLVSSAHIHAGKFADSRQSSTGGSNHLQSR